MSYEHQSSSSISHLCKSKTRHVFLNVVIETCHSDSFERKFPATGQTCTRVSVDVLRVQGPVPRMWFN